MLIVVGLALIIVLTAATGYFVAQEFGYVAVDRGKLKQLADAGDARPPAPWRSPAGCRSCSPARNSASP